MNRRNWLNSIAIFFLGILFLVTSFVMYLFDEAGSILAGMWMYEPRFNFWTWMEVIHLERSINFLHCFDVLFVYLLAAFGYVQWWRTRSILQFIFTTLFVLMICNLILTKEMSSFLYQKRILESPAEYLETIPDLIKWAEKNQDKWQIDYLLRKIF